MRHSEDRFHKILRLSKGTIVKLRLGFPTKSANLVAQAGIDRATGFGRQEGCKVNKQEICPQMTRMNADEEEETR